MQRPQQSGQPDACLRYRERHSLHKIFDGNPIFDARVPDAWRHACFSRRLHAGVVARRIVSARADFQQIWRSAHDDAKDQGRSEVFDHSDVFKAGYSESIAQAAIHPLHLFLWNHAVLHATSYNRTMQRSTHKILTTHVGSLPALEGFTGEAAVRQVVERQRQIGLDIINEGEYTKGGDWLSFTDDRFGGFTAGERKGPPMVTLGKDRTEFADFYTWASQRGTLFFEPGDQIKSVRKHWICTGPITYSGHAVLKREIDLLKAAAGP